MEIGLSGFYNSSNRNVDLHVQVVATAPINYSSLKLRIGVTESGLNSNGHTHNQVFRDMVPDASGIGFTINQGETLTFDQNFTLDTQLNANNCEVVAFVQSDNGHRVLQGVKEGVINLREIYALDPFSLISPSPGDTVRTCFPSFVWESSDDPDSGYAVSYEVMIDLNPLFPYPILSGALTDTSWVSPICLINDTTYYWKVRAFNGHAPEIFSNEINSFQIFEYSSIQGTVTGDNSDSLEGVFVSLLNAGLSDTTDSLGSYSFADLYEGAYDISYSLPGYRDTTITGVNAVSGVATIIDVMLYGLNCQYTPGDVNGSGAANGLDVTYLTTYLKGGPAPVDTCICDPHGELLVGADANGSCSVNGLDVTFMVSYFKGTGTLLYCLDCPPQ